MRKKHRMTLLAIALLLATRVAFAAISGKDVLAALDNPSGVEFVKFEYCVQKQDADGFPMFNDDTGEPVFKTKKTSASSDKWIVQSKFDMNTHPQTTKCLRSANTATLSSSRIYLRVFGPGTFALKYKTSTEMGDCLNVYVDGEEVLSESGYDVGYTPAQANASAGDSDWHEELFRVPGGKAEQGSQAGTYYHEILIEYAKDEWTPDGPVKPVKPTLAGCGYDRELYREEMEWYEEELADYNVAYSFFKDCVWIDAGFIPLAEDENYEVTEWETTWTGDELELTVDSGIDVTFVDSYEVNFDTNAYDFGYIVRYTTNGSVPKSTSEKVSEGDVVPLTETCTLTTAVFDGFTRLESFEPVALTFTRQGAMPVFRRVEEQSGADAQAYEVTTTTPDGVIWVSAGAENAWTKLEAQPLMVTAPGPIYAKTVPASATALESGVSSVTVLRAAALVIRAVCGERVFASGDVLDENESVVFTSVPQAETTVAYSIDGGAWTPLGEDGLTIGSAAVVRFRAETPGFLASPSVEYNVRKATVAGRFEFVGESALRDGWNLLSFPVRLATAHRNRFLELAGAVFTLNGGKMVMPTEIEPGKAYFCHFDDCAAAEATQYHGMEVTEQLPEPATGWNMVGVLKETTAENAWLWNGKRFERAVNLVPGRGYFILKEP